MCDEEKMKSCGRKGEFIVTGLEKFSISRVVRAPSKYFAQRYLNSQHWAVVFKRFLSCCCAFERHLSTYRETMIHGPRWEEIRAAFPG